MKPGNDSPCEFELFNKLDIGALVLDYRERRVLFTNRYFKSLAGENEPVIVDNLLHHLDSKKRLSLRSDMKIGPGSVIGYTVYQLTETRFLVFLSDISYKKIYLQNLEENQFYDKLSRLMAELVHEIGNPLTSVTTTLQVLNESIETWPFDKKREYIHRAVNEIERLSKYLKKVRDFSAANHHIRKKPVHLEPYLPCF
jgi:nitrogen-specific signal transduction histidine kinase